MCEKYIIHIAHDTIIEDKEKLVLESITLNNLASLYLSEMEYSKS